MLACGPHLVCRAPRVCWRRQEGGREKRRVRFQPSGVTVSASRRKEGPMHDQRGAHSGSRLGGGLLAVNSFPLMCHSRAVHRDSARIGQGYGVGTRLPNCWRCTAPTARVQRGRPGAAWSAAAVIPAAIGAHVQQQQPGCCAISDWRMACSGSRCGTSAQPFDRPDSRGAAAAGGGRGRERRPRHSALAIRLAHS